MPRTRFWLIAPLALGLLFGLRPAAAQTLERWDSREAFLGAAGAALAQAQFETLAEGTFFAVYSEGGATFRSIEGEPQDLAVYGPETLPFPQVRSRTLFSNRNFNPLVIEFAEPVTAFGADLLTVPDGAGVVVTVDGTDGTQTLQVPLAGGGPAFLGLIARTGAIVRVTVSNLPDQQAFVGVDDVCFGQAATPAQGDPLAAALNRLAAAIEEGRADGSIRAVGASLAAKAEQARRAVAAGRPRLAALLLTALGREVQALRGRLVAPGRADRIAAEVAECLRLLAGG